MVAEISFHLDTEVLVAIQDACQRERNPLARDILQALVENSRIAAREHIPLCQDTGTALLFIELGAEVFIDGPPLPDIVNNAIRSAWKDHYLRASIASDPLFQRQNTLDNTPAVLHVEIVSGDRIHLCLAQKGGGAENMSALHLLAPSFEPAKLIDLVVDTIKEAGGKPCPPLIVGIGIGGNFETCALLAKKALFLPLHHHNPDIQYAALEADILKALNGSDVGPQGLGGDTTALAVHILQAPCHIASLPVAINLQCHAHRHACMEI